MDLRTPTAWIVIGVFVLCSSVLGLRGFMGIWAASIAADLIFTLGSAGVFAGQFWLAARGRGPLVASLLGGLLHWLVYAASFQTVLAAGGDYEAFDGGLIGFVGHWGIAGLLFAAVAPAAWTSASQIARRAPPQEPARAQQSPGHFHAATLREGEGGQVSAAGQRSQRDAADRP